MQGNWRVNNTDILGCTKKTKGYIGVYYVEYQPRVVAGTMSWDIFQLFQ